MTSSHGSCPVSYVHSKSVPTNPSILHIISIPRELLICTFNSWGRKWNWGLNSQAPCHNFATLVKRPLVCWFSFNPLLIPSSSSIETPYSLLFSPLSLRSVKWEKGRKREFVLTRIRVWPAKWVLPGSLTREMDFEWEADLGRWIRSNGCQLKTGFFPKSGSPIRSWPYIYTRYKATCVARLLCPLLSEDFF